MIIGFTNMIIYLNLLSIGYTFTDYLSYIFRRFDCLINLLGFIIICLTIFEKGEKHDLHIWYFIKL